MRDNNGIILKLNPFEKRVLVRRLADIRNIRLSEDIPTDDLDDVILKVIDASSRKKKRRCMREER